MTQRHHPASPFHRRALARPLLRGWRATAIGELHWIRAWWSGWMSQGLEWLLRLGRPNAATILEMNNLKRGIPEIGEIDQAVRSLHDPGAHGRPHSRTPERRSTPFDD
jgi:hypothetical protein